MPKSYGNNTANAERGLESSVTLRVVGKKQNTKKNGELVFSSQGNPMYTFKYQVVSGTLPWDVPRYIAAGKTFVYSQSFLGSYGTTHKVELRNWQRDYNGSPIDTIVFENLDKEMLREQRKQADEYKSQVAFLNAGLSPALIALKEQMAKANLATTLALKAEIEVTKMASDTPVIDNTPKANPSTSFPAPVVEPVEAGEIDTPEPVKEIVEGKKPVEAGE